MRAIALMEDEAETRSSRHVLSSLRETVTHGHSLSSGLAAFRSTFGELGIHLIEVGETSGSLPEHLERFSESIQKQRLLRRKVTGALIYPVVIIAATLGITALLMFYVFPKIIPVFRGFHAALPLSTQLLIGASGFFAHDGLYVFGFLTALAIGAGVLLRIRRTRLAYDRAVLRVPLIGTLLRQYAIASLCRTLGALIRSGVGVVRAVEFAALGTGNLAYREACVRMAGEISAGQKVSVAFGKSPVLFPRLIPQMLSVGESTGSLSDNLLYCADFYEDALDELSKNISVLVEPVLMIVMGLVVGFVALAIITPIYSITQNLTPYH
jgi:type II secretory pathway component PulF